MPALASRRASICVPRNLQYPHSMSAYSTIVTAPSALPSKRFCERSMRRLRSSRGSIWKSQRLPLK